MDTMLKTIFLILLAATMLSCTQPAYDETYSHDRGTQSEFLSQTNQSQSLEPLNADKAAKIGHKIWMNEGLAKLEKLTVWKSGDNHASVGIGRFVWYPAADSVEHDKSFPKLLLFLQKQGTAIPDWLQNTPNCPWNSRRDFYDHIDSPQMVDLRTLLKNTLSQQVQFLLLYLEKALLPKMMAASTKEPRFHLREQFYRVAQLPAGVYALIDYVNFKGDGTDPKQRYKDEGWGLLQVLEEMPGNSKNVMAEFAQAADNVLTRRVQNAPQDEQRWLSGWRNRIKTYTYEI
jgi:hypothetical protein